MKYVLSLLMLAFALVTGVANAADAPSVAEVQTQLLTQLETDGVLTAQEAQAAKAKYVQGAQAAAAEKKWTEYLSLANFAKVVGVVLLLVAFHGVIVNIVKGVWHLIVAVPLEVYQFSMLTITVGGLFRPDLIYAEQSFYVALFCAFATPMVLVWIAGTHEKLAARLAAFFSVGLPIGSVVNAWACAYFALLAFAYSSQIFGFFAVVAFAGVLTFGMTYRPGVLSMDFDAPKLPMVVLGHAILIGAYIGASMDGAPEWLRFFKAGVEYYATIALGVALLCGASPWWNRINGFYSLVMIAAAVFGAVAFHVLGFPVIGSILMVFFVLWALEWLGYMSFKVGVITGCFTVGALLFFGATLFEKHHDKLTALLN